MSFVVSIYEIEYVICRSGPAIPLSISPSLHPLPDMFAARMNSIPLFIDLQNFLHPCMHGRVT